MTRRPFLVRIRTRNPETLLRLRLVPCSVRCVIHFTPDHLRKLAVVQFFYKVTIINHSMLGLYS
jgi:hypothetical protein